MAQKTKSLYVCSECGYEAPKWYGKCPGCGEWNTMEEAVREAAPIAGSKVAAVKPGSAPVKISEITGKE